MKAVWGLTAAAALTALAACGASAAGGAVHTCVSWADLSSEQARHDAAELVVDATVGDRHGNRTMFGADAHVWEVEVHAVAKGDAEPGEHLLVASTPETCSQSTYPDGDPLENAGTVRLYLNDSHGIPQEGRGWSLITPFDGVGEVP